jgi:hypothetical protein
MHRDSGAENVLDLGDGDVIDFGDIRFGIRDGLVAEVFPEDELVVASAPVLRRSSLCREHRKSARGLAQPVHDPRSGRSTAPSE